MSSIRSISASNSMPYDLARKIGVSGVTEILSVLWRAYHDLRKDHNLTVTVATPEDDITQEWYIKVQKIWDHRNRATCVALNILIPHHQYGDATMARPRGKRPTIDFCFRDWQTSNSYFGAECKNLYDNSPAKIRRYIDTGVMHYVTGRYGSQSTISAVVGYVLSGEIHSLIEQLRVDMTRISPLLNMTRIMTTTEIEYKSRHSRQTDNEQITIHHLLFSFLP